MKSVILIPAYEPSNELLNLVKDLADHNKMVVVVNDGSNASLDNLFLSCEQNGATVLQHDKNQGKGQAIKTGISYIQSLDDVSGVVTCDADGQHLLKDILKVEEAMEENPEDLTIGSRDFISKSVPWKSRFGNSFSRTYFRLATGISCYDTQTGLRGIPKSLFEDALSIPENRYDYEMNFLKLIAKKRKKLIQIPIETVYLEENSSSHFKPLLDSYRIYKEPIRFTMIGLSSAAIDLTIFTILSTTLEHQFFQVVLFSTIIARILSGAFNFLMNRIWSFKSKSSLHKQLFKYLLLYVTILGLSSLFVYLLSFIPIHLTIIKAFVDTILFIFSFIIQKHWVFRKKKVD